MEVGLEFYSSSPASVAALAPALEIGYRAKRDNDHHGNYNHAVDQCFAERH